MVPKKTWSIACPMGRVSSAWWSSIASTGIGRGDAPGETPIRHTAEVIIVGWSPSSGHADVLGALLLAAHDLEGRLVYVGDVGTGFTDLTFAS